MAGRCRSLDTHRSFMQIEDCSSEPIRSLAQGHADGCGDEEWDDEFRMHPIVVGCVDFKHNTFQP